MDKYTGLCQHHPPCQLLITRGCEFTNLRARYWSRGAASSPTCSRSLSRPCSRSLSSWDVMDKYTGLCQYHPTCQILITRWVFSKRFLDDHETGHHGCVSQPPKNPAYLRTILCGSQTTEAFHNPQNLVYLLHGHDPLNFIYTPPLIELTILDNKWTKIVKLWPFS